VKNSAQHPQLLINVNPLLNLFYSKKIEFLLVRDSVDGLGIGVADELTKLGVRLRLACYCYIRIVGDGIVNYII
jgi:hypothetical protein